MAKPETERGRLNRERVLAQDEVRRAADAAAAAEVAEILYELACFEVEADSAMSGGRTVGISLDIEQSYRLLAVIRHLDKGEDLPWGK